MEDFDLKKLIANLGAAKQATAHTAWHVLDRLAHQARGTKRGELAAGLAHALVARNPRVEEDQPPDRKGRARKKVSGGDPVHSAKTRRALARLLGSCGGEKQVPALAECLADADLRDMARWALDRIQAAECTTALCKSLDTAVGPEFRAGIANALAYKAGEASLAALKALLKDVDQDVRAAAGDALAKHADPSVDAALQSAIAACAGHGMGRLKQKLTKARVRHAGALAAAGNTAAAKTVYKSLLGDAEKTDEAVQRAARIGLNGPSGKVASARP